MIQEKLAERLRILRAKRGLGLVEASERIGIERHTLRDLERGARSNPRHATLTKIARAYGVPVETLLVPDLPLPDETNEHYLKALGSAPAAQPRKQRSGEVAISDEDAEEVLAILRDVLRDVTRRGEQDIKNDNFEQIKLGVYKAIVLKEGLDSIASKLEAHGVPRDTTDKVRKIGSHFAEHTYIALDYLTTLEQYADAGIDKLEALLERAPASQSR